MTKTMTPYSDEICYVGHDHEAPDGRPLEGGWHYTVVPVAEGSDETMPGEKLHLDESGAFRLAAGGDESHRSRFHGRLALIAPVGNVGDPRTDEEYEATYRHLDELEQRIKEGRTTPDEDGHILSKPEHVITMRDWLKEAQARP